MTKRYKGHVIKRTTGGAYDVYYLGDRVAHGPDLRGAKFWIDHYGKKSNPGVRRHVKVGAKRKAAVNRRVASALAGFLRKMNPGTKAAGAKVQRLKGGVIKITPLKANPVLGRGGVARVLSEYKTQRKGGSSRIGGLKKAISSTRKNPRRRR